MDKSKTKPPPQLFVVSIDQAEVVCIMLEELSGTPRPPGKTAMEALMVAQVMGRDQAGVDHLRGALERASVRIIEYVVDVVVANVPGAVKGGTFERPAGRLQ